MARRPIDRPACAQTFSFAPDVVQATQFRPRSSGTRVWHSRRRQDPPDWTPWHAPSREGVVHKRYVFYLASNPIACRPTSSASNKKPQGCPPRLRRLVRTRRYIRQLPGGSCRSPGRQCCERHGCRLRSRGCTLPKWASWRSAISSGMPSIAFGDIREQTCLLAGVEEVEECADLDVVVVALSRWS